MRLRSSPLKGFRTNISEFTSTRKSQRWSYFTGVYALRGRRRDQRCTHDSTLVLKTVKSFKSMCSLNLAPFKYIHARDLWHFRGPEAEGEQLGPRSRRRGLRGRSELRRRVRAPDAAARARARLRGPPGLCALSALAARVCRSARSPREPGEAGKGLVRPELQEMSEEDEGSFGHPAAWVWELGDRKWK